MTTFSGQGRERLITATAATSDANGLISFRVGPAPLGFVWQGSVTITGAPSGALFNASVASTPWGQWAGPTNFGPVQCWGNETLIVTGVGLQKNTQYSMLFFGVAMPEEGAEPLPPVAPLSTVTVETSTLLIENVTPAGSPNRITGIRPPTLTRRLTIIGNQAPAGGNSTWELIGEQTGTVYGTFTPQTVPHFFAIEPTVDSTYKIQYASGAGTSFQVWVLASLTNPLIVPPSDIPLIVAGSPVGTFNLQYGAVLGVAANQVLVAAQGAGTAIYVQSVSIYAAPAGAANSVVNFHAAAGTPFTTIVTVNVASQQHVFPGGFRLPDNTALQADVGVNATGVQVTYAIGPTV